MCAEKVESAASMDCASPMSARNAVKTGKLAAAAGTGRPAWAIMASSAVVLSVTVLPPVLGPLMMSWRAVGGELQSERDDAAAGCAQTLFEQRMAGGFEAQPIGRDGRGNAVVVAGEAGAGLQAVDQREHARASTRPRIAADLARERDKDAMNLGLLFFDEADQLVVLLDGFERLDVDRLAGRAGAVDDAGDAALELARTGMTKRSPRMVMRSSWVAPSLESLRSAARRDSSMTRCWRSCSRRMRPSSGEALSASEPSGWMVRSMDSASGRRLW
jgi:hypothetical protein